MIDLNRLDADELAELGPAALQSAGPTRGPARGGIQDGEGVRGGVRLVMTRLGTGQPAFAREHGLNGTQRRIK